MPLARCYVVRHDPLMSFDYSQATAQVQILLLGIDG